MSGRAPTVSAPAPSWWARLRQGLWEAARARGLVTALEMGWITITGGLRDGARLSGALGRLKGPFAKLGQLAALRVDAFTPATREQLASLRERVPPIPFWRVCTCLEAELGRPLGEVFAELDETPLGAASIAQVHRGRLVDGREVAVKVQYPWLEASADADLALLHRLMKRMAGGPGREAWFEEFAQSFRGELDFAREAEMTRAIAARFADDEQVLVPTVIGSHSTSRVLTMSYLPGLSLADPEALQARGVPQGVVLDRIVRAFAQQVFVDGLFQADPHPGNLQVVDEPEAATRPRVLLVDFGLSQRLDPELRREMRQGIYALLQNDLDGFVAAMGRMQMIVPGHEDAVGRAVATMFERLRGAEGGALALSGDRVLALKDEATALLYETPGLSLPPQLLLTAKTLSTVFALGRELAPELDVMKLAVPYLLRFLATPDGGAPAA